MNSIKTPRLPKSLQKIVRPGCYVMHFIPTVLEADEPDSFTGTFRIEIPPKPASDAAGEIRASGDLYAVASGRDWIPWEIPTFAVEDYRYYLSLCDIRAVSGDDGGVEFDLESQRFHASTRTWTNEGVFTAAMRWNVANERSPRRWDFLEGTVYDPDSNACGAL